MTTLAQLADRAQAALSDDGAAIWSQTQIEEWVIEGVRAYSRSFPRFRSTTISALDGVHEYTLPDDFLGMVSLQYPASGDPPVYLVRANYTDPGFWDNDAVYDILVREDGVDADELRVGISPATGEAFEIEYKAYHVLSTTTSTVQTIPAHHEDIIVQYVYWKAHAERVADEAANPTSNSSLLMSQLDQIAGAAFRKFNEMVRLALVHGSGRSGVVKWDMNYRTESDRIY